MTEAKRPETVQEPVTSVKLVFAPATDRVFRTASRTGLPLVDGPVTISPEFVTLFQVSSTYEFRNAMSQPVAHGQVASGFFGRRQAVKGLMAGTVIITAAISGGNCLGGDEEGDGGSAGSAEAPPESLEDEPTAGNIGPEPGLPTFGGMQFWADVRFLRGFKIQQNVLTGHYRLLSSSNRRYASGKLKECEEVLRDLQQTRDLQPDDGHAVIYLHGIGRSSRSLRPIINAMTREGWVNVPVEYPSTRVPLSQSAGYLHSVIESLTGVSKISFVVHSMGGLVVRRYLMDHRDPRIFRMVMLGTPNRGAELADMLKKNFLFKTVYGPAGQELVTDTTGTIQSLPIPDFEFGIIAGGKGDDRGFNRLLPGDDDGTVTVASARMPGATDFLRVPRIHSFLMHDPTAIAAVQCFLEHGRFFADRAAAPIAASQPTTEGLLTPSDDH